MNIIGKPEITKEALATMRERGGEWYAYQNHDLGHSEVGCVRYMKCGKGCTFETPPEKHPDTERTIGWRWILVGKADINLGKIVECQP